MSRPRTYNQGYQDAITHCVAALKRLRAKLPETYRGEVDAKIAWVRGAKTRANKRAGGAGRK